VTAPPSEVGDVIGAQMADENNPGGVLLIDQTISGFKLPLAVVFGGTFTLSASGGGSGEPVAYAASGACSVAAGGNLLSFTGTGMCQVTPSEAGNASFAPAPDLTLSVTVAKATATVTIDAASLRQIYDGSAKTIATTTSPGGLQVDLSFTGTPQSAGSYPVDATINDVNLQRIRERDADHR
jgi:MBG domain-containing protein